MQTLNDYQKNLAIVNKSAVNQSVTQPYVLATKQFRSINHNQIIEGSK
jgi:hypothetical protein